MLNYVFLCFCFLFVSLSRYGVSYSIKAKSPQCYCWKIGKPCYLINLSCSEALLTPEHLTHRPTVEYHVKIQSLNQRAFLIKELFTEFRLKYIHNVCTFLLCQRVVMSDDELSQKIITRDCPH